LKELVDEGKVRAVGLSNVSVSEIKAARSVVPIVTVQNLFNLTDRSSQKEFDYCAGEGIGFIPYFPIATGDLNGAGSPLEAVVAETGATPSQVALAWLLAISPVVLPIPGTSSVRHLEENCQSVDLQLSAAQIKALDRVAKG
jgi:pyridoxine 4-dehydrogenase